MQEKRTDPYLIHATSFAILFIAANNQLQSPSAEDDVLSSAGRDQIVADALPNNGLTFRDAWNQSVGR